MDAFNTRIPAGVWLLSAALLAVALVLPFVLPPFQLRLAQQILLFGGMAIGWGLLGGFTTYWSFGHTAFFGLGAFAAGLLGQQLDPGLSVAMKLLIGMVFAVGLALIAAVAISIPVLKLRGIYFAIAMLAFAEILGEITKAFDSFHGTSGFPLPALLMPGLTKVQLFYFLFLALFIVNVAVFVWLRRSRIGMGLTCVGQDEDTAAMLGIPTERYKLIAFVLSAAIPGMVGAVMALRSTYFVVGQVFDPMVSVTVIAMALLGGGDGVRGPILGVLFLALLSEALWAQAPLLYMILLGAILVVFVLLVPDGLIGLFQRWRRKGAEA